MNLNFDVNGFNVVVHIIYNVWHVDIFNLGLQALVGRNFITTDF